MNKCVAFVIIIIFQMSTSMAVVISTDTIQLFNGRNLTGSSKSINVSSCVSLENDEQFDEQVASINTFGSCVMVYHDMFCLGFTGQAAAVSTKVIHDTTAAFGFTISSLGPCPANCSSPSFEKGRTYVSFSAASGAEVSNSLMLLPGGCLNIQHQFTPGDKELINLSNPLCIQFYDGKSCNGDSKMFPVSESYQTSFESESDFRNESQETSLSFDILPVKWQHSGSISLCGFNCIGSPLSLFSSVTTHPAINPHHTNTIVTHKQKYFANSLSSELNISSNSPLTQIFPTLLPTSLNLTSPNKTFNPLPTTALIQELHNDFGQLDGNKNSIWFYVFAVSAGIGFVFIVTAALVYRRFKHQRRQGQLLIVSDADDYL